MTVFLTVLKFRILPFPSSTYGYIKAIDLDIPETWLCDADTVKLDNSQFPVEFRRCEPGPFHTRHDTSRNMSGLRWDVERVSGSVYQYLIKTGIG